MALSPLLGHADHAFFQERTFVLDQAGDPSVFLKELVRFVTTVQTGSPTQDRRDHGKRSCFLHTRDHRHHGGCHIEPRDHSSCELLDITHDRLREVLHHRTAETTDVFVVRLRTVTSGSCQSTSSKIGLLGKIRKSRVVLDLFQAVLCDLSDRNHRLMDISHHEETLIFHLKTLLQISGIRPGDERRDRLDIITKFRHHFKRSFKVLFSEFLINKTISVLFDQQLFLNSCLSFENRL